MSLLNNEYSTFIFKQNKKLICKLNCCLLFELPPKVVLYSSFQNFKSEIVKLLAVFYFQKHNMIIL